MRIKNRQKLLNLINEHPGMTRKRLSECMKANISEYLKTLEKEGLIKKFAINKKIDRIHPTKKGKDSYLSEKLKSIQKR